MTHDNPDPILAGVIALADQHPTGLAGVLAATLEAMDEGGTLEWGHLSTDTRSRVRELVADSWRSPAQRTLLISALENGDLNREVVVVLGPAQLDAAIARIEVALDNPFGDEDDDRVARDTLGRLMLDHARIARSRS